MSPRAKNNLLVATVTVLTITVVVLTFVLVSMKVSPHKAASSSAQAPQTESWTLRSRHFVFGMPAVDDRYNYIPQGEKSEERGISVLVREGFVVAHADRFKVPLFACMYWSRDLLAASSSAHETARNFRKDPELPEYAQGEDEYRTETLKLDRGHLARHLDNAAWGDDNVASGNLMSNIIPQIAAFNRGPWKALEDTHRELVAQGAIKEIWIICGSIFPDMKPEAIVGNGIGVPPEVFKIIAWFDSQKKFHAVGFIFPQHTKVAKWAEAAAPIDEIERRTGINFFPLLPREEEPEVESTTGTLPVKRK
jgi:endonuclease G